MANLRDAVIIGGGPGGLYAAILLKRDWPSARVRVVERNRPGETFGFGIAFHRETLRALAEADTESRAAIDELLVPWDDVAFHVRGTEYRVSGHAFSGCSRHRLLAVLQRRATDLGVELRFERTAGAADFPEAQLIVAADGVASRTRRDGEGHFGAIVDRRPNRYLWLASECPLEAMNFFFAEAPPGIFVAHAYPYQPGSSTWIVETDEATFAKAGLGELDQQATAAYLQEVFARHLRGHTFTTNDSSWTRFPLVRCREWVHGRLVLLGDAKGTVHYSMGSGTKLAMEDAVALHRALQGADDVAAGLDRYQQVRRPALAALQQAGFGSMLWFESVRLHWAMDTAQFVFAGVTRKSNETYRTVAGRNPSLVEAARRAVVGAARDGAERPLAAPFDRLDLRSRLVLDLARGQAPPDPGTVRPGLLRVAGPAPTEAGRPVPEVPRAAVIEPAATDRDDELAARAAALAAEGYAGLVVGPVPGDRLAGILPFLSQVWPGDRWLGVRLEAPEDPEAALAQLGPAWDDRLALVDLTARRPGGTPEELSAGRAAQLRAADLLRHRLGVATLVEVNGSDQADTALAAGRTDLVLLAP